MNANGLKQEKKPILIMSNSQLTANLTSKTESGTRHDIM